MVWRVRRMLVEKGVPFPADPILLARALAGREGVSVLLSGDDQGPSWVAADPVESADGLDPEPGLGLSARHEALGATPRWIGVLPYESCRHLERPSRVPVQELREAPHLERPCWHRYDALARTHHGRTCLIGDSRAAVEALEGRLARGLRAATRAERVTIEALPVEAPELHAGRIRQALELIRAGDLYQVNLARRFDYRVSGGSLGLLQGLVGRTRAPFAAALAVDGVEVVSTSPELFLELRPDGTLRTEPIKGTRPRSQNPEEDRRLALELDADPKERAELTMILDVERNDLGRIAQTGSVHLLDGPRVKSHPTIHHRQALLGAKLQPGLGRGDLLRAMLPSGSVTGAPKVRAMEVIASLEPHRRGLYTGALGVVNHSGGLILAIAIRTLTVLDGVANYYSGGGIVADSDPDREVQETLWKARQLQDLVMASQPPVKLGRRD